MLRILAIETSCDECAASVVEGGEKVLSNIVLSQVEKHAEFGGVVPELAAREHLASIEIVIESALKKATLDMNDIDAIAFTNGPGLVPALLIGANFARALAFSYRLPLIPVNHFTAHIRGAFLDKNNSIQKNPSNYPMIALVVSGGHTALIHITANSKAKIIGQSLDDAAGEAFDKGAKILGLSYPGGPAIEKTAQNGNPAKFAFPRALTGAAGRAVEECDRFNFSFSGLKTALQNHIRKSENYISYASFISDTAASFQEAIVDVLVKKTIFAAETFSAKTIVISGGVACNQRLREKFLKYSAQYSVIIAEKQYCTDNAAMIAAEAFYMQPFEKNYNVDVFARLKNETIFSLGK